MHNLNLEDSGSNWPEHFDKLWRKYKQTVVRQNILTFQLEKTFGFEVLTSLVDREGVAGGERSLR